MNEPEKVRCHEYSRALFGKSLKSSDLEDLVKECSSYEEFRILIVHKFANKNGESKKIAVRWQDRITVTKPVDVDDANNLLHKLESLSQKQNEWDRRMREANAELLDRLKALDAMATNHATLRKQVDEVRFQIFEIRKCLERSEVVPSHGVNGSK